MTNFVIYPFCYNKINEKALNCVVVLLPFCFLFFVFANKIQNCSVQICQSDADHACDRSKAQNANNLLAHSVPNEIYRTKTLEVKQKNKKREFWAEVSSFLVFIVVAVV